jgi:hypothetical protein
VGFVEGDFESGKFITEYFVLLDNLAREQNTTHLFEDFNSP